MLKTRAKKRLHGVRRLPVRLAEQEIEDDRQVGKAGLAGRVSIDRYLDALRKGVMLSQ